MSTAPQQLRSYVERIERIEEEIRDFNSDKRDIYQEAKSNGFDVKALKAVVAIRRKDVNEQAEHNALVETYLAALGSGTIPARVRAHESAPAPIPETTPEPAPTTVFVTHGTSASDTYAVPDDGSIPAFLRREQVAS